MVFSLIGVEKFAELIAIGIQGLFTIEQKLIGLAACRNWGGESKNQPRRGHFLPGLQGHSWAMGPKHGEQWVAAADRRLPSPTGCQVLFTLKNLKISDFMKNRDVFQQHMPPGERGL